MGLLASNGQWQLNGANQPVSRWAEWARSFSDRLQPASLRGKKPQLVLRRQCGAIPEGTRVLQWTQMLRQLFSRIFLVLNHALKIDYGVYTRAVGQVTRNSWRNFTVHPIPIWNRVVLIGKGQMSPKEEKVEVGSGRNRLVSSELKLLVRQVSARPTVWNDSDLGFEQRIRSCTSLAEVCHRTVRRVLEKCERVEERRMQSLVLRREVRTAVGTDSDSRPREIMSTSPWGASVGKSGFAMTNGQMPIDLKRLTDQVVHQIDSRMTAYRERMGKVF